MIPADPDRVSETDTAGNTGKGGTGYKRPQCHGMDGTRMRVKRCREPGNLILPLSPAQ